MTGHLCGGRPGRVMFPAGDQHPGIIFGGVGEGVGCFLWICGTEYTGVGTLLGPEGTATHLHVLGVGVRVLWAVMHRFLRLWWGLVVVCKWVVKCRVDASIFFLDVGSACPSLVGCVGR